MRVPYLIAKKAFLLCRYGLSSDENYIPGLEMASGRRSVVGMRLCSQGRRYDKHVVNSDRLRLVNTRQHASEGEGVGYSISCSK